MKFWHDSAWCAVCVLTKIGKWTSGGQREKSGETPPQNFTADEQFLKVQQRPDGS